MFIEKSNKATGVNIRMRKLLFIFLALPSMLYARDIKINENYFISNYDDVVDIKLLDWMEADESCIYSITTAGLTFELYIGGAPLVEVEKGSARMLVQEKFPCFLASSEMNNVSVVSICRVFAYGPPKPENQVYNICNFDYLTACFWVKSKMAPAYENSVIDFLRHVVRGKCEAGEE